jgi:hypothetical protein
LLRRENHPGELRHGGDELNPDSGEKRPKRFTASMDYHFNTRWRIAVE